MYCSNLPFLMRYSGGCAMYTLPALDQLRHVPEEEGQQQRPDVRSVDIGIGHQDQLAVAQLGDIKIVLADARAQAP